MTTKGGKIPDALTTARELLRSHQREKGGSAHTICRDMGKGPSKFPDPDIERC